jgi:hypothetical protein
MRTAEANTILEKILKQVEKNGIQPDKLIPLLQQVREFALKEEDPLLTRALRLCWQHLEANEGFDLTYLEDGETTEENFTYLISLAIKSENTYNRDEIREMTNMLQATA